MKLNAKKVISFLIVNLGGAGVIGWASFEDKPYILAALLVVLWIIATVSALVINHLVEKYNRLEQAFLRSVADKGPRGRQTKRRKGRQENV